MTYIAPINAAKLAGEVYVVNEGNPASLKIFLSNSLLSSGATKVLSAEVGFRAISATDGCPERPPSATLTASGINPKQ